MPDGATLILDNWLIFSKICILVWIIREKTGDNPHWESDSIDNKCVTKLVVAPSHPTSDQHVTPETYQSRDDLPGLPVPG